MKNRLKKLYYEMNNAMMCISNNEMFFIFLLFVILFLVGVTAK